MRVPVEDLRVSAYVIPTATPESDGTLEWDSTTLVLVELEGGGKRGIGYSALCEANNIHLSAHTAPTLHVPVCCALAPARHVEYFFDHARIEEMLFDGFPRP